MTTYHDPQTPPGAEAMLAELMKAMEAARRDLAAARDEEVATLHDYKAARRRAMLSAECPKVRRDHCTVAERDAWVEEQCSDEELAHELAKAARQAASDHLNTLRAQVSAQQSIARSVGDSFRADGRQPW